MIIYLKQCALFYLLNGLAMIVLPELWYQYTPGAADTGPFNLHFVRDIGIAFTVSGAGLWVAFSQRETPNLPLAWLAIAFLVGHSILHQVEMITMTPSAQEIARDFTLIVLPVLIAVVGLVRLSSADAGGRSNQQIRSETVVRGVGGRK
ncbi:MAG: hypothetical protein MI746_15090 [Pseudomonadales bacterium]|nr:hypothetical protein [Pseudomonadales bacterium]